jgi:hypothetical protein
MFNIQRESVWDLEEVTTIPSVTTTPSTVTKPPAVAVHSATTTHPIKPKTGVSQNFMNSDQNSGDCNEK